jgi:5-methylthioadenosine/S-adenosylhomocysteine deaminase
VATAAATIVHNPVGNYRLCSGIASVRALMEAGVNIAIGTDGMDSFNLFNVIRAAGLTHSVIDSDYERYPKAANVLKWATYGGARSALLHKEVRAIAPGATGRTTVHTILFSIASSGQFPAAVSLKLPEPVV